jgi:hypothetical protein
MQTPMLFTAVCGAFRADNGFGYGDMDATMRARHHWFGFFSPEVSGVFFGMLPGRFRGIQCLLAAHQPGYDRQPYRHP